MPRLVLAAFSAMALSGLLAQAHPPVEKRHPHLAESHRPHDAIRRHPHEAAFHAKPPKPPSHGPTPKGTHPKVSKH